MTRFTAFKPKVDVAQIAAALARRERQARTAALAAIFGGLALSMLGPILVYGLACLTALKYHHPMPGWPAFAIITAIVLPLLVAIGYYYQGGLTLTLSKDIDWDSSWSYQAAGRAVAGLAMIETLLMLASLTGYGIRRLTALQKLRSANRQRAAEVLAALAIGESGQNFQAIMAQGETWEQFHQVVDYLLFFDLAGVSLKRRLLWISSEARDSGVLPP